MDDQAGGASDKSIEDLGVTESGKYNVPEGTSTWISKMKDLPVVSSLNSDWPLSKKTKEDSLLEM